MSRVAMIAGQGRLAPELAQRIEAPMICALDGFAPELPVDVTFRLERLVPFLDHLHDHGVTEVCFAGAVRRPDLDPEAFDSRTAALVPRILGAMGSGDDAALRAVIEIFEEYGFHVRGTAELAPDLLPCAGVLTGQTDAHAIADAGRAAAILRHTGPLDLGQGAVVAGGLCLALETLPGTAAMLDFVARTRNAAPANARKPRRGVMFKAPKPGQDRRIDLPSIGPDTLDQAAQAGLAGVAFEAGGVIVLDRADCISRAKLHGLFLWSRAPQEADADPATRPSLRTP